MKLNLPVNDQETPVPNGISLVSKTDLKGVITYANDAFVDISGFSREELIGKNHNLVRHPDMPQAAFEWMWNTLKAGRPWRGRVKNRRKDGGFYWVDACVVPIRKDNITTGYMSVRRPATPEDVTEAELLYARLNAGEGLPKPSITSNLTIRRGFWLGCMFVILLMIAGGILGIGGLKLSNDAIERMYQNQLQAIEIVDEIGGNMLNNHAHLLEFQLGENGRSGDEQTLSPTSRLLEMKLQREKVDQLWVALEAKALAPSATQAASNFREAYTRYVQTGLVPIEKAIAAGQLSQASRDTTLYVLPLYHSAAEANSQLRAQLSAAAKAEYQQTLERNQMIWRVALAGIALGALAVLVVGRTFLREIVQPLDNAIARLDRIGQGDLSMEVDISGRGETGKLNRAIAIMQLHLKVMMDEITLVSHQIYGNCHQLNRALLEVAEHSEEQHDRVYQATDAMREAADQSAGLSNAGEQLANLANQVHEGLTEDQLPPEVLQADVQRLLNDARELATSTRLQAFGAEEVAYAMRQVAALIVDNRHETQSAYSASESLKATADELQNLVSYFEPPRSN